MKRPINVLLIEDNPDYRNTLKLGLETSKKVVVVGEFGVAERALRFLATPGKTTTPDIILLDLNLPGMPGIDSIKYLYEVCPAVRILILTQSESEQDVISAIKLGASGYLLKSASLNDILNGISNVHRGGAHLNTYVAKFLVDTLKLNLPNTSNNYQLTGREKQVLELLATGLSKKEIAEQLSIGVATVVTHVSHLYDKLEVPNAPAAISKAYKEGLLK